jgi:hypothetical protein
MPTSAESHLQLLQYRKKGGSPRVEMGTRPSSDSGGSEGTTVRVFLQLGQRKQFRAHLSTSINTIVTRWAGKQQTYSFHRERLH